MKKLLLCTTLILLYSTCKKVELPPLSYTVTSIEADSIVFAAIGDYGDEGDPALMVSELVKSWSPDFIITLGDNNYERGLLSTFDQNIGQYYCDYIYNPDAPDGYRCNGMAALEGQNRFFPTLGNHDQESANFSQPYLSMFTLPEKETYYSFKWGPVEFFTINSGRDGEADCCGSEQAIWLKDALANSSTPFKIVYFHHPPYSSSKHGSNSNLQWPFKEWGADIIFSGHSHQYERINEINDPHFYYIVNGLGGRAKFYDCNVNPLDNERFNSLCYDQNYGAMKLEANSEELKIRFINVDELVVDEVIILSD